MITNTRPLTERLEAAAADLRGGVIHGGLGTYAELINQAARQIEMNCDAREVRRFAGLMTAKLARKSYEGKSGWRTVPVSHLWAMLREHVEKGDPRDIAIFAMMIHHNAETEGDERQGT